MVSGLAARGCSSARGLALGVAMLVVIIVSVCDAHSGDKHTLELQPKRLLANFLLIGEWIDMEGVVSNTH